VSALFAGLKLAVRTPDWLGDLVMAEPVLRALHRRVTELRGSLTLIGDVRLLEVFDGAFDGVDRASADDPRSWRGHDVALLLVNSFRSAWAAARAGVRERIGYSRDVRGLLLTTSIAPAREAGATPIGVGTVGRPPRYAPRPYGAACAELAASLGVFVDDPRPRLAPGARGREEWVRRLRRLGLEPGAPYTLVNVGARPESAKGYPPRQWGAVLAALAPWRDEPLVLVCGPGEEAALREAQEHAGKAPTLACLEPVASLPELVALCAGAKRVLTADAGPRHIANAVGARVVVVCGPTDPRHTADNLERTTLLRVPIECGPCHREQCRFDDERRLRCMTAIEPERVARAAM
jgi:heptosyltransferase-2